MDNKVITQMENIPDDVFDNMMGGAPPASSANENDIVGGTKPEPSKKQEEDKPEGKPDKQDEPKILSDEEAEKALIAALGDEGEEDGESEKTKAKPGPKPQPKKEEYNIDYSEFYKNKALALMESGAWYELEDGEFDKITWSEDEYVKMAIQQAEWKAEDTYNERKERLGSYKVLIDHIENGGDPEDLLAILREAKKIENIDKSTDEGKISVLKMYYVDELGWSESKFKKYSNALIDDKTLDAELEEVQGYLDKSRAKRIEEEKIKQEEYRKEQEQRQLQFANTMKQTVGTLEIPKKEQAEILNNLLVYNQKLPDGRVVNKFTIDFMQLQADPKKYIDLVRYISNPDKYVERVATKSSSDTAKKDWNLIKGSGAVKKDYGNSTISSRGNQNDDLKIDYKNF